ncbi:uncharacterized protein [Dermacentor andersoni]|uniref:uncharacterized protein n=1 Tax=Dermacentor andersoni TaxID=34620 RepID=UPI003B3B0D5D
MQDSFSLGALQASFLLKANVATHRPSIQLQDMSPRTHTADIRVTLVVSTREVASWATPGITIWDVDKTVILQASISVQDMGSQEPRVPQKMQVEPSACECFAIGTSFSARVHAVYHLCQGPASLFSTSAVETNLSALLHRFLHTSLPLSTCQAPSASRTTAFCFLNFVACDKPLASAYKIFSRLPCCDAAFSVQCLAYQDSSVFVLFLSQGSSSRSSGSSSRSSGSSSSSSRGSSGSSSSSSSLSSSISSLFKRPGGSRKPSKPKPSGPIYVTRRPAPAPTPRPAPYPTRRPAPYPTQPPYRPPPPSAPSYPGHGGSYPNVPGHRPQTPSAPPMEPGKIVPGQVNPIQQPGGGQHPPGFKPMTPSAPPAEPGYPGGSPSAPGRPTGSYPGYPGGQYPGQGQPGRPPSQYPGQSQPGYPGTGQGQPGYPGGQYPGQGQPGRPPSQYPGQSQPSYPPGHYPGAGQGQPGYPGGQYPGQGQPGRPPSQYPGQSQPSYPPGHYPGAGQGQPGYPGGQYPGQGQAQPGYPGGRYPAPGHGYPSGQYPGQGYPGGYYPGGHYPGGGGYPGGHYPGVYPGGYPSAPKKPGGLLGQLLGGSSGLGGSKKRPGHVFAPTHPLYGGMPVATMYGVQKGLKHKGIKQKDVAKVLGAVLLYKTLRHRRKRWKPKFYGGYYGGYYGSSYYYGGRRYYGSSYDRYHNRTTLGNATAGGIDTVPGNATYIGNMAKITGPVFFIRCSLNRCTVFCRYVFSLHGMANE